MNNLLWPLRWPLLFASVSRYICKRCNKNHPDKGCQRNLVQCNNCGKMGHCMYECYSDDGNSASAGGGQRPPASRSVASVANNIFQGKSAQGYFNKPVATTSGAQGAQGTKPSTSASTSVKTTGKLYALNRTEAEESPNVVTGTRHEDRARDGSGRE